MGWVYSLNHLISPSHISWDLPRFVAKFRKVGRHERPKRGWDTSICTSTAYKVCQTSFTYIILMWDECGLGLQPQSPHFTITYQLRLSQICGKMPKGWLACEAITWWGHIHMLIHSIKMLSNTFPIYNNDVRWIWVGSIASITSFHHHISAETCPDL